MFEMPTTIDVNNKIYPIRNKGDFRVILDCFKALDDIELDEQFRVAACLIIFYEDFDELTDISKLDEDVVKQLSKKMFDFMNCGQESIPQNPKPKLLDWEQDEQIIASAINKVANQEIRLLDYLHWWTFMGYYMSIGESLFSTITSIRAKIVKGKKLEKYEQDFRNENPQYFTWNSKSVSQREADEWLKKVWNSHKEE